EDTIDAPQRGVQRVPRALLFGLAPEHAGEMLTGVQAAPVQGQVSEQLAGFAAGEALDRAAVALELEGTEEPDVEGHGRAGAGEGPGAAGAAAGAGVGGAGVGAPGGLTSTLKSLVTLPDSPMACRMYVVGATG